MRNMLDQSATFQRVGPQHDINVGILFKELAITMAKIFLHIGLHKTGSTAIQSAFNGLNTPSKCYADLGFENHSIPIYTAFSGKHQEYGIWRRSSLTYAAVEQKQQECLAKLDMFLRKEKHKDIIISGEDISVISAPMLKNLYQALTVNTSDVNVLAYVRDPVSFIASALQEEIKNGSISKIPSRPNYRAKLEKFLKQFGEENVIIREYNRDKLPNGDVVEDFGDFVGVKAPHKAFQDNKSLSTEAVRVVYQLNQIVSATGDTPEMTLARLACINHLRRLLPGRFTLPEHLIAGLVEPNDVDWLYEVSSIDFRTLVPVKYTPFNPNALVQYLEDIEPATLEAIRNYLRKQNGKTPLPTDAKFLLARYLFTFVQPVIKYRLRWYLGKFIQSRFVSALKR